jgi:hypothetical protein
MRRPRPKAMHNDDAVDDEQLHERTPLVLLRLSGGLRMRTWHLRVRHGTLRYRAAKGARDARGHSAWVTEVRNDGELVADAFPGA